MLSPEFSPLLFLLPAVAVTPVSASRLAQSYHRGADPEQIRLWEPCQRTDWCWHLTDYGRHPHFSGTITNSQLPGVWDPSMAGFVLSPAAVELNCAYSGDASTMGRRLRSDSLGEGEESGLREGGARASRLWRRHLGFNSDGCHGSHGWCTLPRAPYGDAGCAWAASHLDQSMQQQ